VGQAPIRAEWDATSWFYSSFSGQCETSTSRALAGATCNVLNQAVTFEWARFSTVNAPFNSNDIPAATLNLIEGTGGSTVCAGPGPHARFRIFIEFQMPVGANALHGRGDPRTRVSQGDDHQFAFQDFNFQNVNFATRDAEMWIDLVRGRPSAPKNDIAVTISGEYGNQIGGWSGKGRVRLVCP
jgi:hypothetical protein